MIPVPPFVRRALAAWEAHQRRKRFARLLTINPDLRRAHVSLERDRRRHRSTRDDINAMRAAMTARLEREVRS